MEALGVAVLPRAARAMQIEREQSLRVEKLCGLEVPSTEVSRAAAELDEELEAWRSRPFGEFT